MVGVILSSQFVQPSLQVIFGKIVPCDLPIGNKRLLEHHLKFLENFCDRIVLTLPSGYDFIPPSNVDLRICRFNENLSVFELLEKLSSLIEDDVFILFGDTLFEIKSSTILVDSILVGRPNLEYSWGPKFEDDLVPAGGFGLERTVFVDTIKLASNFSEFVLELVRRGVPKVLPDRWLDFGLSYTYFKSRQFFLMSRAFNSLTLSEGFIKKSSRDKLKISSEFNWLVQMKDYFPANIPLARSLVEKDGESSYLIEYLSLPTLSEIFVFGRLRDEYIREIFYVLRDFLRRFHEYPIQSSPESSDFMYSKLLERTDSIYACAESIGLNYVYLEDLIKRNLDYFSGRPLKTGLFHGDFCFSNLLFDFNGMRVVCIDPRGLVDRIAGPSIIGPILYDYYKLAHSFVLGYDALVSDYFGAAYFEVDSVRYRLKWFCDFFGLEEDDLKFGLTNLFLTLLPLHYDDRDRQKRFVDALLLLDRL
jgi:hypothetical protein